MRWVRGRNRTYREGAARAGLPGHRRTTRCRGPGQPRRSTVLAAAAGTCRSGAERVGPAELLQPPGGPCQCRIGMLLSWHTHRPPTAVMSSCPPPVGRRGSARVRLMGHAEDRCGGPMRRTSASEGDRPPPSAIRRRAGRSAYKTIHIDGVHRAAGLQPFSHPPLCAAGG